MGAERERVESFGSLENGLRQAGGWYSWGPYLSERQWGTVREDYSADGEAWSYLPHDHARSRAYRWGEDGLAGFSDVEQRLCLALALWNGRDPILKERAFGLTGGEGNHGEDVKEYWWYLDAVPSHAWNRWRYHYPQRAFPYEQLRAENGRRGKQDPEFELLDTGAFDEDRYWVVEVHYAKAGPGRSVDDGGGHQRGSGAPTCCTCCPPRGSATPGPGMPTPPDADAAATGPTTVGDRRIPFLGELELARRPRPRRHPSRAAVLRQRDQHRRGSTGSRARVPEGRHQRPRRRGRADGEPRAAGQQVRRLVPRCRSRRARRSSCGCGCGRREPPADLGAEFDAGARRAGGPRPTSSTPSSPPPRPRRTRRG